MDPLTIIGLLAQFAPSLLKAVGVGKDTQDIANKAAAVATAITGKADIAEAADTLKADPTLAAKFNTSVLEQETSFEQMYAADKKDARARDIALAATPAGNVRANWLTGFSCLTIFIILFVVIYPPIADTLTEFAKGALSTILGGMLTQLWNIYSFEFGTTRRSREKTDVLEQIKGA